MYQKSGKSDVKQKIQVCIVIPAPNIPNCLLVLKGLVVNTLNSLVWTLQGQFFNDLVQVLASKAAKQ